MQGPWQTGEQKTGLVLPQADRLSCPLSRLPAAWPAAGPREEKGAGRPLLGAGPLWLRLQDCGPPRPVLPRLSGGRPLHADTV